MARKLTEQERQEIEAMRVVLNDALPPAQRGIASGIASALVRTPADRITDEDLSRIMGKYEEADASVAQVVKETLLDAADDPQGTYVLRPLELGEVTPEDGQAPDDGATDPEEAGEQGSADVEPVADEPAQADVVTSEAPVEEQAEGTPEVAPQADTTDGAVEDAGEAPSSSLLGEESDQDQAPEGAEPEAPTAEEPPAPKPKRTRRGARRTHKTVPSVKAQAEEGSQQKEPKPAEGRPEEDKGKGPKAGEGKAKGPKGRDTKAKDASPEKADKTERNDKADKDKAHRKDSAASRDLKKVPYVRRGGETEAEVRQKILGLDQRFWVNGWLLSHPAAYTLYERELVAINDALSDGMLPGDITRRQLAYQMGGDEKFFEYGSDGFKLLRAMGMEDVIRHRPMPKPDLVYYAPRRRKHMRVLVTENLDPYLDVHDLMYEDGRTSILGQRIHAVVLGGGTPILEKNRLALLLDTLGADTITVLYWGDIDRAGLEIMVKLKDVLGDGYKFRAFTPAYQLMVDKAQARFPDPADNESTGQVNIEPMDASLLVKGLTDEAAAYAKAVIDECGLIPQEILTRRDL